MRTGLDSYKYTGNIAFLQFCVLFSKEGNHRVTKKTKQNKAKKKKGAVLFLHQLQKMAKHCAQFYYFYEDGDMINCLTIRPQ